MTAPVFETIAIIGAGLIGASIARAAASFGAAGKIRLYDADEGVRARAGALAIGDVCQTAPEAVKEADCIILCVPVGALGSATKNIAPHLNPARYLPMLVLSKLPRARLWPPTARKRST